MESGNKIIAVLLLKRLYKYHFKPFYADQTEGLL
ncbi:MAG: Uncharacterised protein [Alphaproteobacteria bacterium UBA4588]|nr:MAG: Uncharacterised protein [Alphaproteobacteria bacterium UBA4588]